MTPMMEKKKELSRVLEAVESIGLNDASLPEKLAAFYDDPVNHPLLLVEKDFGGERLLFELNMDLSEGHLHFGSYTLLIDKVLEMPEHLVANGVDSRVLDEHLGMVDWSGHNGYFMASDELDGTVEEKQMQQAISAFYRFSAVDREAQGELWVRANEMADALMLKHFKGTPLEREIIGVVDFRRSTFYDLYPFNARLHASVVAGWKRDGHELNDLSRVTFDNQLKNKIMNLNNLQNLQGEMEKLGFSKALKKSMEEKMNSGVAFFTLSDRGTGDRGEVDMKLHFRQSTQSDYYYLNKYEVSLVSGKGVEEGQKIWLISPATEKGGQHLTKEFGDLKQAMEVFKGMDSRAELAVGQSLEYKTTVALREGKDITFVDKDFRQSFYAPDLKQTFYVDRGEGFTAEQAKNLVQGRAVYRDNLLSSEGKTYKAWVTLDKDKPRDRIGNLVTRQYNDPGYGFDLKASLQEYKIKELSDERKIGKLENDMRNGNRVLITTEKDGKEVKMFIEPAVRYSRINFFDQSGKMEKREQFEKKQETGLMQSNDQSQSKSKAKSKGVGIGD